MIGERIAAFDVEAEIGRGGMGVVYAARDRRLGRRVAIKAIHPEVSLDPDVRRRFALEASAASRLGHPYICQVFDVLEHDGASLIVMEHLEGESLEARLRRGPLPPGEALRVAGELAEALGEAHRAGIVHRDLKPSNVFLTRSGHVKVMDFGLALLAEPAAAASDDETLTGGATTAGTTLGTAGYMPPEQALGRPADARADVFALGVVVFEMLAGRKPFAAATLPAFFYALFQEEPPRLAATAPGLPGDLDALVAAMLAREPAGRPGSMDVVRERLEAAAASLTAVAPAVRRASPATRYARSGDLNIAYQVVGDGPLDLVYVPGWVSHLEVGWEEPRVAAFFDRLASFSRLILFDKRGTGLSDRVAGYPTLEQRMDDVRAVMDAAGSERAAVFGMSEGGNMCLLFAAAHPERTLALVTFAIFAKRLRSPDYPWAPSREEREAFIARVEREWGGPVGLPDLAPSLAGDPNFARWWATYQRLGASPGAAVTLARLNTEIDVRDVLPAIRVPTLVLHRSGDRDANVEEGRYIAARIPGARFVELPGEDHLVYAGDTTRLLDEVETFLRAVEPGAAAGRVLATILCVLPAAGGTLPATLVRGEVERWRGRPLAGAEHLASFDGPARALRAAAAVLAAAGAAGMTARAGVHAGECERRGDDLAGIPLTVARELAARAHPGEALATQTLRDLVAGSGLRFAERGSHTSAATAGEWRIYAAYA